MCNTTRESETKTDAKPPGRQRCVVRFHLEDGGVVLRIQLMIDADLSNELLAQYSITNERRASRGLYRGSIAVLDQEARRAAFALFFTSNYTFVVPYLTSFVL
jgi:hypothetical protein